ncbi:MAG: HAMP domain-containing sensor histidine kinase [Candidatus Paceibacterota bacterium]
MPRTLHTAWNKLRSHPQLWYTLFVALVIAGAFFVVVYRFSNIAQDAEERVQQVRAGSLLEVFTVLLPDSGAINPLYASIKMKEISELDKTVLSFDIVKENSDGKLVVFASSDSTRIGSEYRNASLSFALAKSDITNAYTTQHVLNNDRYFKTVRAVKDSRGLVNTYIVVDQSLSQADVVIEGAIRNSMYLFSLMLIGVMILFLRHARTIDYISLYKRLKEVDTLKDDFISMASHELRTPLTTIRGYAEFLNESKGLSGKEKEYVSAIDTSAQRLDYLVSDMLDVSRIEQGRMSFNYTEVVPENIVNEIVESLRGNAVKKNLSLSVQIKDSKIIRVDEVRLRQVLVNIIGNSIKYTREGSVSVGLYTENKEQVIHVSDTGIGISKDAQEHLFEKFYRVKNKYTSEVVGTGLGLWITKQIIEHMHGSIQIESIENVGTHTKIRFPIYLNKK